jgi:hypothetical protein
MKFQLRHLDIISKEKIDYKGLVGTFNRWKVWKVFSFIKSIKELYVEIEAFHTLDFEKVEESPDCKIKRPEEIDLIPFSAMVELQILFSSGGSINREMGELITDTIAYSCYSSNKEVPFDSDSDEFKSFRQEVSNTDLMQMLGLYKWVDRSIIKSQENWESLFQAVEVVDKDYEQAGGGRMSQFNIINTIKSTCTDFNIPYKEALLFPYGMTQANSLAKATQAHIQHLMSKAIEERMRAERERNK